MASNRRHLLLINPRFQIKFLIYLNIILFVCLGFYSWIILDFGSSLVTLGLITEEKAQEINSGVLPFIILVHVLIHVIVTASMLFVSHRIAGPLQRFRSVIASLIKNDFLVKPFDTRKHDYFDEFRDDLNKLNFKMREDYLNKQEIINALDSVLQEPISSSSKRTIENLIKKHQS